MPKHRATGKPRGRPRKIPSDIRARIMESLRSRVDPNTGLVQPNWRLMAREFGVSRSTIAREMVGLHQCHAVERVGVSVDDKFSYIYYRLPGMSPEQA